ncbi:MAG: alanine--glyoxylate aminotransferase family protein [Thermomicrobiales bacterium]|nr:alanine--glyoxylate aminotransferase family protein [Thermomicrobiales bacterium]
MDERLTQGRWLRIPGPTPLHPNVVRALGHEMVPQRGTIITEMMARVQPILRKVHGTESGQVLLWASTGTAGFEASIVNMTNPGDKIVVTCAGDFGNRYAAAAETLGLDVLRVEAEWGSAVTPEQLDAAIQQHGDVVAVMITHNETSTGVTQDLAALAAVARQHDALICVDAVSSAAALPINMDVNGLDWVLSGAQKAWMCPPGLMISALSERAIARSHETKGYPRFIWDAPMMVEASRGNIHPATAPETSLFALDAALMAMEEEGIDEVFARHARLGAHFRAGLEKLGIEFLAEEALRSNSVTAFRAPGGSAKAFQAKVREQSGIELAVGQAQWQDVAIRVGTMGWTYEPELDATLEAIAAAM